MILCLNPGILLTLPVPLNIALVVMGYTPFRIFFLLSAASLFCSCEETPDISLESDPVPVIFGVFDKNDFVHYLKVGKTFQANIDPAYSAGIMDSLYFKDPEVTITAKDWRGKKIEITPSIVDNIPKNEGLFNFPEQIIYRFEQILGGGVIKVSVKVPGLAEAYGEVYLINPPQINTPKLAQQYLYLAPDSPILIQWVISQSPDPYPIKWYEIDFVFEFIEETSQGRRPAYVIIQNINLFETPTPKYFELNITYEEFIREVMEQIPDDPGVLRRYFGYHSLSINAGDKNMVNYIKYLHGFTDFNDNEFSNITNGIGLLASRSSSLKDSLQFDYKTRNQLVNENRLKKYRLISN